MKSLIRQYGLYAVLLISLAGLLGSLYFGEIMGLVPCVLCWYQRIALYPIVLIAGIGIATQDKNVWRYALPFSAVGLIIAIYHVGLTIGLIPEKILPCSAGVSCAEVTWSLFGFITIPLLSLVAFIAMTALLLGYKKYA